MKHRTIRSLGALLLAGTLSVPLVLAAQDRDDRRDQDRNNQAMNHRVYDPQHKDYHDWNADEQNRYRQWWEEHHKGKKFKEYGKISKKEQGDYWKWRHEHGDRDDHH